MERQITKQKTTVAAHETVKHSLSLTARPDSLTVIDNRTGKVYELLIDNGAIKAKDLALIKDNDGSGLTISFQ